VFSEYFIVDTIYWVIVLFAISGAAFASLYFTGYFDKKPKQVDQPVDHTPPVDNPAPMLTITKATIKQPSSLTVEFKIKGKCDSCVIILAPIVDGVLQTESRFSPADEGKPVAVPFTAKQGGSVSVISGHIEDPNGLPLTADVFVNITP